MDEELVETVTDWDSEPFDGGYDGLRDLADREFSGVVTNGVAWLFLLNGRIVGIDDGDIDAFEGADGTAYAAPDPALPLLYAMQTIGGEQQAQYYTEETPISEVDRKLSGGSFTGYIELSENVLSGDYYIAYYNGRRLPCAFVGTSRRLLTDEEAFERADGEVGIYEVRAVDIDVIEIPGAGTDDVVGGAADATSEAESESQADQDPDPQPAETLDVDDPDPGGTTETAADAGPTTGSGTDAVSISDAEVGSAQSGVEASADTDETEAAPDTGGAVETTAAETETVDGEDPFSREQEWRETRTIPSLDPEETAAPSTNGQTPTSTPQREQSAASSGTEGAETPPEREKLKGQLRRVEQDRDQARQELQEVQAQLQEVTAERDELKERNARLQERVEELESQVEHLQSRLEEAGTADTGHAIEPDQALAGTNLFVRYDSKGGGTLEKAHEGNASREQVNDNLRLETHTSFDASDATVNGQPFGEFLAESIEYRFVEWAVRKLPFEIAETGNESALGDLYDALPRVDRAELRGTVAVDTDDGPIQREFDVVLRDRMGEALVVADVTDSRQATTKGTLDGLVEDASTVAGAAEDLAAAVAVTASYFEPAALEAADDATGGGLLSRDKRRSFVKLSRKRGFHLCLVETRDGEFHVNVPEL